MGNVFESLSSLGGNDVKITRFKDTEDSKAVHREYKELSGSSNSVFSENFIKILDLAILKNNKNLLSEEQKKFFEQYCREAEYPLEGTMKEFDLFLGNYRGGTDV